LLPSNRTPWWVRRRLLLNRHGPAGPSLRDDGRAGRPRGRRRARLIPTRSWRTPRTGQRARPTTPPITSTGAYRGAPASAASIAGTSPASLALLKSAQRGQYSLALRLFLIRQSAVNCPAGWKQSRPTLQWPDLLKSTGRTIALPECRDATMVSNRSKPRTIQE
jgi:hypothetical protein